MIMNISNLSKYIFAVVGSMGGTGVIIIGISKFLSEKIADKLQSKYQLILDKSLEQFKSEIEQISYVNKTRFDYEFLTYQELYLCFNELMSSLDYLYPKRSVEFDIFITAKGMREDEMRKNCENDCLSAYNQLREAKKNLGAKSPFIEEKLFKQFQIIIKLSEQAINCYDIANPYSISVYNGYKEHLEKKQNEGYRYKEMLDKEWLDLMNSLRSYLANLSAGGELKNG